MPEERKSSLTREELTEILRANQEQALAMMAEFAKELKKPYVDLAYEAREQRERAKTKADDAISRQRAADKKKKCRHKDDNEAWAFSLIHNYPDRKVRAICMHCDLVVSPATWDFTFDQKPYQHPEHPLYSIIEDLEQKMYAQV